MKEVASIYMYDIPHLEWEGRGRLERLDLLGEEGGRQQDSE